MTKWQVNVSKNSGATLIEVLAAVGLMTIILLSILTAMTVSGQQQRNLRAIQAFNDQVSELQMGLDSVQACTYNLGTVGGGGPGLQGFTMPAVGQDLTVDLHIFDPTLPTQPRASAKLLTKNDSGGDLDSTLTVTATKLRTVAKLTAGHYLARIIVEATKTGSVLGSSQITEGFPIFVIADNTDKILYCYGNFSNGGLSDLQQKNCEVLVGPNFYWNPNTNRCETRFQEQCFPGTRTQATCPPQAFGFSGGGCSATGVVDPMVGLFGMPRTYSDGVVRTSPPPSPVSCRQISSTTVDCEYALDANTTQAICSACCLVEIPNTTNGAAGP